MKVEKIAATSLTISCKYLYSVKSYDGTNMKVFALRLWKTFGWRLTYFDEFSLLKLDDCPWLDPPWFN